MALDAQYAATIKTTLQVLSTANTARDGTGTVPTLFTAGANGAVVNRVYISATGTTTAGMIRLFLYDGTNTRLLDELPVQAVTPSGTARAWSAVLNYPGVLGIELKASWELRGATNNAETFHVATFGKDL